MSAAGQDTSNSTNSTPTFVSALVTGIITFTVYTVVFWLLHSRFQNVYQPRTLLAPESKRPRVLPKSIFGWFKAVLSEPDIRVGEFNGPDAYFFLRFIKFLGLLLVPYWLISWPILMTLHAIGPNNGDTGLDQFAYGNIDRAHNSRHIADLVVVLVVIAWTLYMLYHEYAAFLRIRQAYLNSPAHAALPRSRTVMINNLPKNWSTEERVRELASFVNGTIEAVWLPRKVKNMEKLFDARNKECLKLEAAEAKVQQLAVKNVKKNTLPPVSGTSAERNDVVEKYVLPKKRPTHRLGPLGLIGKKVDTLEYSPAFIREQDEQLAAERDRLDEYPLLNSAFVRFSRQADAHIFAREIKKQPGARLIGAAVEVMPEDIIWKNLSKSAFLRKALTFVSWAITIFLVLTFVSYVAFVGSISKITTVCYKLKFLNWICTLPTAVKGIIQGILPPALLAILFMLVPIILRLLVTLQGEPRHSDVERKLWYRYWAFLLFDGFLVVAISGGVIKNLSDPKYFAKNAPKLLAVSLPQSSTFFLTFILTNTFTAAASTNSRAVPVVMSKLAFIFRGKTPRKAYTYDYKMGSIALATAWPGIALLGCMAIVYVAMQPIVVAFAAFGLLLLYVVYKYLLIWVMDQPDYLETGGLYYPQALRAVFMSLYVLELVMLGLFLLLTTGNGGITTIGIICGAIMGVALVFTIVYQIWLERRFSHRYLYLDAAPDTAGSLSAEALWPNAQGSLPDAPGTLALDTDLHVQHAAANGMGAEYGNTTGLHPRAFDNPATWKRTPTVWIADDTNGIGRAEAARLEGMHVEASTQYATMDEAGKVEISRGPPDEAWYGGKTA